MNETVILVAKDIVLDLVEGRTDALEGLSRSAGASGTSVVIPVSCLTWALENADSPRVEGLHALARLLCVATVYGAPSDAADADKAVLVTDDALLCFLVGAATERMVVGSLSACLARGLTPTTSTAALARALLCVREGDVLHTGRLAKGLQLLTFEGPAGSVEEPVKLVLPGEFVEHIRAKALKRP